MIEVFGVVLGTPFQGATVLSVIAAVAIWWIRGAPDRQRADNEGRQIEVAEHTLLRADYVQQIKDFRKEVHSLRNELQVLTGQQIKADGENRRYKEQVSTMMFLIRLLISELKRLDPDSVIIAQAEATLEQMGHPLDPNKSAARQAAEDTVTAAQNTLDEVSEAERGNG